MKRRRVLPAELSYLRVAEEAVERLRAAEGTALSLAPPMPKSMQVPAAIQNHEPLATKAANREARRQGQLNSPHTPKAASTELPPISGQNARLLAARLRLCPHCRYLADWIEQTGGAPSPAPPAIYP
jgi:hypothetical protein